MGKPRWLYFGEAEVGQIRLGGLDNRHFARWQNRRICIHFFHADC